MIWFVLSVVLSSAGERPPALNPESIAARTALVSCVERAATRLERSRETADIVAQAAIAACTTERDALQRAAAGDDRRFAAALMPRIDEHLRQLAQARVVTIRANRP